MIIFVIATPAFCCVKPHTVLRLYGVNCASRVLPLRDPGAAVLVPRALPLATELLPLRGCLRK